MTRASNKHLYRSIVLCGVVAISLTPLFAFAEGYILLSGIEGLSAESAAGGFKPYLSNIYKMAIVAAAMVAVIKLILAGAKYVLSGIVTDKEDAKKDIRAALIGLLIILAAVTLLTTINPQFTDLPALENAPTYEAAPTLEPSLNPNSVEYWCREYGENNCGVMSCDFIENGSSLTLWNAFIYLIDTGDRVTCSIVCPTIFSGHVVETSYVSNTGKCVYPKDWETYIEKATEEETETLDVYDITKGTGVEFASVPFASRTVIDDRREETELAGLENSDFVGYLTANWYSEEGQAMLAEYGNDRNLALEAYEYEVLREACKASNRSNRLIDIPRHNSEVSYYCVKG